MNHPNYEPLLISGSNTTPQPIGAGVATTTTSTVVAGTLASITLASTTNVTVGMNLNLVGGTVEVVTVLSVNYATNVITANCALAHSGTTNVYSIRSTFWGRFNINQIGTLCTVTIYNGHPNLSPTGGTVIASIVPSSQQTLFYDLWLRRGGWYTCTTSGGLVGSYTVSYLDGLL